MDLASHITLGETLPVQAARPELAHQPALCFGDQRYTCAVSTPGWMPPQAQRLRAQAGITRHDGDGVGHGVG